MEDKGFRPLAGINKIIGTAKVDAEADRFRPLAGINKIGKSTPIAFHLPMQYNIPILFCIGHYMHFMEFVGLFGLKQTQIWCESAFLSLF